MRLEMMNVSDMPELPPVLLHAIIEKIGGKITEKVRQGQYASIPNEEELQRYVR